MTFSVHQRADLDFDILPEFFCANLAEIFKFLKEKIISTIVEKRQKKNNAESNLSLKMILGQQFLTFIFT